MATERSRRSFLRGKFSKPEASRLRLPGAQPEFSRLCTGCGDCARACPEGIVVRHASGEPEVDFSKGPCTFCGDCADACGTGALRPEDVPNWPWRAAIQTSCLAVNGISCRACEDACEPRAIRFRLMTGGRAAPILDKGRCTGCGDCAFACPVAAVRFEIPAPARRESA